MIRTGVQMLRLQQTSMACVAVVLVSTVTFQSAGKAMGAFLLSVMRQGVFLAVVLSVLAQTAGYVGILISQPTADLMTALLAVPLFVVSLRSELSEK